MRLPSLLLALGMAAAPAAAFDIIELKSGKVLEVEEASVRDGKLRVRLRTKFPQRIAYAIPIGKVVPEFVFYVWAGQLEAGDLDGHRELAEWARRNGLFRQALRTYEAMAGFEAEWEKALPGLKAELRDEEATWHFTRAEALLKQDEVKAARVEAEIVLTDFLGTGEVGRAAELLNIIKEREQFLGEKKRKAEIARRARKQKRVLDRQLREVSRADALASRANLRYVADARWRLRHAGYLYSKAAVVLSDLAPLVEVDELRRMIDANLEQLGPRISRTLVRLADLRYLSGDLGGALDAVHQVLDIEPGNEAAVQLRDRILDGPGPTHVRYRRGFLSHRRSFYYPYPYYGFRGRGVRPAPYAGLVYRYR